MALVCAAIRRDSVSLLKIPFLSHIFTTTTTTTTTIIIIIIIIII